MKAAQFFQFQFEEFEQFWGGPRRRPQLQGNALEIFNRRYRRKDAQGNFAETIPQAYRRVAQVIAGGEEKNHPWWEKVFYNFLVGKEFIPNAPTWTGAGTPLGQLAACFVLPLEDDLGRHPAGIFQTLRNAALIQQSGGGNGFSFSRLRPRGDIVHSSMGKSTGPIGFLQVFDSAFGEIAQGGIRRGANMAVLRVDHPDIEEFIKCKSEEGVIRNFNISVALTDAFMNAVEKGSKFALRNPRDGKVWREVEAAKLFDLIAHFAHRNGEPGVLFIDTANRANPVPQQYQLEATNPCGEQWLGPFENCCLGHLNLAAHLENKGDGVKIDWEHLRRSTWLAVRFLDNIVSVNKYVAAVPQLQEAAQRNRRIGLGFTALGDLFYSLGVRYGSPQAAELAAQITEFIRYHALAASIALARERGSFPGIKESIYNPRSLSWSPPQPLSPYREKTKWQRPSLDWNFIQKGLEQFGLRNATQMTVAPTGSTSTVLGVEGYGCEPVFALAYFRNVYQAAGEEGKLRLRYLSPLFQAALEKTNLKPAEKKKIIEQIAEEGSCQKITALPQSLRQTFVVAADIKPEEHVLMQAAIQAFVDNSISKTCNFPATATVEDVKKAYFQAWKMGCKGLTVYVAGSRHEVVLETKVKSPKKAVIKPRPLTVQGETHQVRTPWGSMFVTVNTNGDQQLHEVFINIGKAGSDLQADAEAIGRLISLIFRLQEADNHQRLAAIVEQLEGIGGRQSMRIGKERFFSIPDAIAKVLRNYLGTRPPLVQLDLMNLAGAEKEKEKRKFQQNREQIKGAVCPECGNYSLVEVEGCQRCAQWLGGCGEYSAC